ncbi:MAG: chloramphenicol acetyltransferase [Proteobacteria bacterium]|nr:chloramphenicol acetyltransferase [Pseudomonadota bacterium]MBU1584576.1 chloramphenicol acetyltransferase [Pseudomonadota bacterium]MBU2451743.1 chloramphenicol acetyltransferase [Pseudomonadota bacterium]MBU2630676.1 chloramphenicol acetyltransferase [Pseudomonadota bacterium]
MKTLDMKIWPRAESFNYFNDYEYPLFNVCAQIQITKTVQYLENHGISKHNAILWMISCAANSVTEIRYRIRKKIVVEHDRVDPSFAVLVKDHSLAFCAVEYSEDVPVFFTRVDQGIATIKANPKLHDKPGVDNLLYISCIPWISFTAISHPVKKGPTDCIPRISWGKFIQNKEMVFMPVSLQLHHGLADGYHAGLFFNKLEELLDQPEAIDWPIG